MSNVLLQPGRSWSLYGLTAVIGVAVVWAYFTEIDVSIRARGVVRPDGQGIRVFVETGGRIRGVFAGEGDDVEEGAPLVELDGRDLVLKKRSTESRIHYAEMRLQDLERRIEDQRSIEEESASVDAFDYSSARRAADV